MNRFASHEVKIKFCKLDTYILLLRTLKVHLDPRLDGIPKHAMTIERIQPGHPQQNGRHERMHRTLKIEATRPAGKNCLQQQAKLMPSFMNLTTSAPMKLSI